MATYYKKECATIVLQSGLPLWIKSGYARKELCYVKVLLVYVSVLGAIGARHSEKDFPLLKWSCL